LITEYVLVVFGQIDAGPVMADGVAGAAVTTTSVTEAAALGQPLAVTIHVYEPASDACVLAMLGFCVFGKLFGPVQSYVTPEVVELAVKLAAAPTHTGLLTVTVGVAGVGLTVTVIAFDVVLQPLEVTCTV
jgi:hypothetical protein